jgi:undecaprenyl-diphosphatase
VLISLAVAVLCLILFGWIAEEMLHGDTLRFDMSVRTWVHQLASPALTQTMIFISLLGDQILIVELILVLLIFLVVGWRRAAAWLAVTMLGVQVLDTVLKHEFHRVRPQPYFVAAPTSFSFPSGHAITAFCFYGVLAGLLTDRIGSRAARIALWAFTAILIIAIGLSRIYLGVHYPSDVIAGYLAGAVWVGTIIVLDHLRKVRRGVKIR